MTDDARFEDGGDRPVNLGALDDDDLGVISALVQDAVLTVGQIRWQARHHRLALLVNRLRREDPAARRPVERVRSVLAVDTVLSVTSQGIDPRATDTVLSILALRFEPDPDIAPGGNLVITLAGDGAIRARVEAIDLRLRDVTRPYAAPSGRIPSHDS